MKINVLCFVGFLLAFIAVRHVFPAGILFYQGVLLALLVGMVQAFISRTTDSLAPTAALKEGLLVFLLAYSFMFTVPTTVDRSYSVKLIGALGKVPEGLRKEQLESLFSVDFVRNGAVTRRIEEQTRSGLFEEHDERIRLTRLGRFINHSFDLACVVFTCRDNATG